MALSQDAKNYGNRPRLRGKHMRSGPLADVIREVSSPLQTLEFTVDHTQLNAASATENIALPALPVGAEIVKVMCMLKRDFAGASGNITVKLGDGTTHDKYGAELDIKPNSDIGQGVRHVWVQSTGDGIGPDEVQQSTSELALQLRFAVAGGDNVAAITAGEFKVCVLYAIMPL